MTKIPKNPDDNFVVNPTCTVSLPTLPQPSSLSSTGPTYDKEKIKSSDEESSSEGEENHGGNDNVPNGVLTSLTQCNA